MLCEQVNSLCLTYGFAFSIRGLAMFALGLAVLLALPRSREIPLGWSFRYVGAFALAQSASVWLGAVQSWRLIEWLPLEYLRTALRILAATILLQFGCYVLAQRVHRLAVWLRRLPFLAALIVSAWTGIIWASHAAHWNELARWIALTSLFLPGMALAAMAFWRIHAEMGAVGLKVPDRDAKLVALVIIAEAVVVVLIVAPAPWARPLAPWAQGIIWFAEFARPWVTVALAVAVIRFLRLFDLERERRLESMARERQEALKKAEEAQLRLEQEIARWSAQLEALTRRRIGREVSSEPGMARWRESVEAVAVARERERISQELHDGIAQLLGYLHLRVQAARRALVAGRLSEAALTLQQLERLAETAYSEVREAVLGLRLASVPDMEEAIREYIEHFQARWNVNVEWAIKDPQALRLSPLVELQLLRVLQEALTNVRKHAQARQAHITLQADDGWMVMTVEDDGIGFDPEEIRMGHFGLRLMRERCESVGGSLRVESTPGRGTRIEARLPLKGLSGAERGTR
ncbi:MAG: sensor histidine kinase [Anaerolineae bacterium]|nr:sensor histidine kinase [Anaerolineae bacterium]MDW8097966.1 sensor histidine kinase [Anaerolineae bacterium]